MPEIITCPECNTDWNVSLLKPGTRIRCKRCSSFLTLPGGVITACISCGHTYNNRHLKPGVVFRCIDCGTLMEIGESGMPHRVKEKVSKRVRAIDKPQTATNANGKDPGVADAKELADADAELRVQKRAPAPAMRRFTEQERNDPTLDTIFEEGSIIATMLIGPDGMITSTHYKKRFDAEIIANSLTYLRDIAKTLGMQFGLGNGGSCVISMEKGQARLVPYEKEILAIISSKEYSGMYDKKIADFLKLKKDLVKA